MPFMYGTKRLECASGYDHTTTDVLLACLCDHMENQWFTLMLCLGDNHIIVTV